MKVMILLFTLLFCSANVWAQGREISYDIGTDVYKGYLATPDGAGPFPAVLVVHEWWGLNDYAKMRADQLARAGYVALAMDVYGNGATARTPKDAGALAGKAMADINQVYQRVQKALSVLKEQSTVKKDKVAAIGYCFGGGVLVNAARMGLDVQGVVSFHGNLAPKTDKRDYHTKLLILHGAADPLVSKEEVSGFKDEMKEEGVNYELVEYPGALHAFTNPSATKIGKEYKLPIAYNQKADAASWEKMMKFFSQVLK